MATTEILNNSDVCGGVWGAGDVVVSAGGARRKGGKCPTQECCHTHTHVHPPHTHTRHTRRMHQQRPHKAPRNSGWWVVLMRRKRTNPTHNITNIAVQSCVAVHTSQLLTVLLCTKHTSPNERMGSYLTTRACGTKQKHSST